MLVNEYPSAGSEEERQEFAKMMWTMVLVSLKDLGTGFARVMLEYRQDTGQVGRHSMRDKVVALLGYMERIAAMRDTVYKLAPRPHEIISEEDDGLWRRTLQSCYREMGRLSAGEPEEKPWI